MEISSVIEVWKILKWLPWFILKRIFTKERMADLLIVDVRPRHDYARVDLGEVSTYEIWFQVINMSPFDVEMDRAEIEFRCAGTMLNKSYIKKTIFDSGKVSNFRIKDDIPEGKANSIARHYDSNDSSISIHIDFNCKLFSFNKQENNLSGVIPSYINTHARKDNDK
ncbi:MAG: hypothetical protein OEZ01_12770 [Candidatus Heimdallarchaeota archaeon]|nr:hypothetical protein [Candidatus Heimdallarchaeota archaeon]